MLYHMRKPVSQKLLLPVFGFTTFLFPSCTGQLGDGTTTNRFVPGPLKSPYDIKSDWVQVSCGYHYTAAIDGTGKLFTWGADSAGRLAQGIGVTIIPHPVYVSSGVADPLVQVSTGRQNTCARSVADEIFCSGADSLSSNGGIGTTYVLTYMTGGVSVSNSVCTGLRE
jgi:alpha-tubulin suppressor-like RCC1 family protein